MPLIMKTFDAAVKSTWIVILVKYLVSRSLWNESEGNQRGEMTAHN